VFYYILYDLLFDQTNNLTLDWIKKKAKHITMCFCEL